MESRRWGAALAATVVTFALAPSAQAESAPPLDAVTETLPDGGGTVSTNAESSPADPVGTTVTSPRGGTVSIQESALPAGQGGAGGVSLVLRQVVVKAPRTAAGAPLLAEFRLDRSLLDQAGATLTVYRNGREVPGCADLGSAAAEPAPCLERAATAGSTDAALRIRTTQGGTWTFGLAGGKDTGGPAVACAAPDGRWHADNVVLNCTATAPGGLASPSDESFDLATSVGDGSETAAAATGSRRVCDTAGRCVTAGPVAGNKVDRKAPSVDMLVPTEGATYGLFAKHTVNYTCLDAGSGPASCRGTVPDGAALPTGALSAGDRSFTVVAVDGVGNRQEVTRRYKVGPVASGTG